MQDEISPSRFCCVHCRADAAYEQRNEHTRLTRRSLYTIQECRTRLAYLCRQCHTTVHRRFTTSELADEWNTVEKLLQDEQLEKWARYASRQKVARENRPQFGLRYAR